MSEFPTLEKVVAVHRWSGRLGNFWDARCTGCSWRGDIRNTGKSATGLHAEHVQEVWREACTITTVEQLGSLPVGVILIDPDVQFTPPPMFAKYTGGWKFMDMGTFAIDIPLPSRLIWHPEWSHS